MPEICNPLLVSNAVPASWMLCCGPGVRGGEEDMPGTEKGTRTGTTVKVIPTSGWIAVPELQRDRSMRGEQLRAAL